MSNATHVQTHPVDSGWVVADDDGWLPGIYDTDATARAAAELGYVALNDLEPIYSIHGENRPVSMVDVAALGRA